MRTLALAAMHSIHDDKKKPTLSSSSSPSENEPYPKGSFRLGDDDDDKVDFKK